MGREYIVLIRLPNGTLVALMSEDDGAPAVFNSERAVAEALRGHILEGCPRQLVELEV